MASRMKKPGSPARKPSAKKTRSAKTRVLSSKLAYKGRVFSVYSDEVIEPTGVRNTREIIRHSGSVVILAIDESKNSEDPEVIFERQYRHAAGQFLLELPAGRREPNEPPLKAAKREMIEETGYDSKRVSFLGRVHPNPAIEENYCYTYVARDVRIVGKPHHPDSAEETEVVLVPLKSIPKLIATEKITHALVIAAFSFFHIYNPPRSKSV